jgi:pyruvate/2-oxoglutarate/acetoin dehydrogenase E1 component
MGMAEALRDAMRIAMRADPTVFLLGEDIGVPGGFGGGFTVTLGLAEEFGRERVIDTPISEGAIVGAAVGAAMAGSRPVAEMQYGDFVFCAMDQVVNQAAKMRYMSNGKVRVPMVLRLPVGAFSTAARERAEKARKSRSAPRFRTATTKSSSVRWRSAARDVASPSWPIC